LALFSSNFWRSSSAQRTMAGAGGPHTGRTRYAGVTGHGNNLAIFPEVRAARYDTFRGTCQPPQPLHQRGCNRALRTWGPTHPS
jgi:hypothetical protein